MNILVLALLSQLIFLDPGHGGNDSGATGVDGEGYPNESDLVLETALKVRDNLEYYGFQVLLSRETDEYPSLINRTDKANSNNADIYISIHLNSSDNPDAQGTETFASVAGGKSEELASYLQGRLLKHLNRPDRGVKIKGYTVLTTSDMPAALTEALFMSNEEEFDLIYSDTGMDLHVKAITEGILDYYNIDAVSRNFLKGFVYLKGNDNTPDYRIAGVKIVLQNNDFKEEVLSDDNGLFKFINIKPGSYNLSLEKEGFISLFKNISIKEGENWASTGIEPKMDRDDDETIDDYEIVEDDYNNSEDEDYEYIDEYFDDEVLKDVPDTDNQPTDIYSRITGVVSDASTKKPVPETLILIENIKTGKKWGDITDSYGEFEIAGVDSGKLKVYAHLKDYYSEVKELEISDNSTVRLEFYLTHSSIKSDKQGCSVFIFK